MSNEVASLHLKRRLINWALEQALPEKPVLKHHFRSALVSVSAYAAVGMLLVVALLVLLAALHYYLISIDVSSQLSLAIIGGIILLAALLVYSLAKNKLEEALNIQNTITLLPEKNLTTEDVVDTIQEIGHEVKENLEEKLVVGANLLGDMIGGVLGDVVSGFAEGLLDVEKSDRAKSEEEIEVTIKRKA